jgi:uncharacterized protein YjlB
VHHHVHSNGHKVMQVGAQILGLGTTGDVRGYR